MNSSIIKEEFIICPYCFEDYGSEMPMGVGDNDIFYCSLCENEFYVNKNKNGTFTCKMKKGWKLWDR